MAAPWWSARRGILIGADAPALADRLRSAGVDAGLDRVGFAGAEPFTRTRRVLEERRAAGLDGGMAFTYRNPARSTEPARALPGVRSIVVGARRYQRRPPVDGAAPAVPARIGRYSWVDHYRLLRNGLQAMADVLTGAGWSARILADDNALVDRAAAHRAGLGWYGRNTNLLLGDAGSWFVLGSVLTDAPLPPGRPVADGCGPCRRCITGCPTGALSDEGALDARRCLAWLLQAPGPFPVEHRIAVGDRLYGCDTCQEVCPVNTRFDRRGDPPAAEAAATPATDALGILAATDDELLERWGRWWTADRQPRWLRRNALLVIGNTADPGDPGVVAALRRALTDPDPVLVAHAVWAAARLGRRDLPVAAGVDGHPDPEVIREVRAASTVETRSDGCPPTVRSSDPSGSVHPSDPPTNLPA